MPKINLAQARIRRACNGHPLTDMNCCSKGRLCGIGEGDCDYDWDCQSGLKCGRDNCFYDFPTSYGYNWEIMADCCYGTVSQKYILYENHRKLINCPILTFISHSNY